MILTVVRNAVRAAVDDPPPEPTEAVEPKPLFRVIHDPSAEFITKDPDGTPVVHAHDGQWELWNAPDRFLLLLAGTRSGKSALAPWWLLREMKDRGPGQYLAAAPNFPIFEGAAYIHLRRAFVLLLRLGKIVGNARGYFQFSPEGFARIWPGHEYDEECKIVFAHAGNPDRLEGAQYKAAWLDECGQPGFKQQSWEAVQRRLAIDKGRALLTTTPYVVQHWIKNDVHDPFFRRGREGEREGDYVNRVISFDSRMNPAFDISQWNLAKANLPEWKFDLFYRGRLTRPAGAIYDCFNAWEGANEKGELGHLVPATFRPEATWKVYVGLDYGSPNFAATFFAEEPGVELVGPPKPGGGKLMSASRYYAFAEYRPTSPKTTAEHVQAMRQIIGRHKPDLSAGGARSEGQWRAECAAAGWPVCGPDQPEVEVGITRTYAVIKNDRLRVSLACPKLIAEFQSYAYEVDDEGNPSNEIAAKETYHSLDSVRYLLSYLNRNGPTHWLEVVTGGAAKEDPDW